MKKKGTNNAARKESDHQLGGSSGFQFTAAVRSAVQCGAAQDGAEK